MFFLVVLMLGTSENTSSVLNQIKDCNHNDEAGCNESQHKAEELHEAVGMLNAGVDFIFGAVKEEPARHRNNEDGAERHQDVAAEEVDRIKNVLVHDLVISPRTHRESRRNRADGKNDEQKNGSCFAGEMDSSIK